MQRGREGKKQREKGREGEKKKGWRERNKGGSKREGKKKKEEGIEGRKGRELLFSILTELQNKLTFRLLFSIKQSYKMS